MSKNKLKYFFNFIILITLQGCNKSLITNISNIANISKIEDKLQPAEITKEKPYPLFNKSKLIDIPFPINVYVYDLGFEQSDKKFILKFKSKLAQFDLIAFYRCEMEYLGWQEDAAVNGHESILLFSKPSKICMIFFNSSITKNITETSLFICPSRHSHSS